MKLDSDCVPTKTSESAIEVRVPLADEVGWFDEQLAARHYLGAGRPVGDYLRQVVVRAD